jgi:hypothetical protein
MSAASDNNNNGPSSMAQHFHPQNVFGIVPQIDPSLAHTATGHGWPYSVRTAFLLHISTLEAIFQQMHAPLDASHLSSQHYTLVHSLSGDVLRATGNKAYSKLEKENLALRDRVDGLQCVFLFIHYTYIILIILTQNTINHSFECQAETLSNSERLSFKHSSNPKSTNQCQAAANFP